MNLNEFLLIFRIKSDAGNTEFLPEEILSQCKYWNMWLTNLAVRDLLISQVKRWDTNGKVIQSGKKVIEGPYTTGSNILNNVITIVAADYDEAKEIARSSPILEFGGIVEIRMAI